VSSPHTARDHHANRTSSAVVAELARDRHANRMSSTDVGGLAKDRHANRKERRHETPSERGFRSHAPLSRVGEENEEEGRDHQTTLICQGELLIRDHLVGFL
jgi:hypothetical protein